MTTRIKGIFSNLIDAMAAVDSLKEEGYMPADITVVANETIHDSFPHSIGLDIAVDSRTLFDTDEEAYSLWEKVRNAFTLSEAYSEITYDDPKYDTSKDILYPFKEEINRGGVAVLVEEKGHPPPLNN